MEHGYLHENYYLRQEYMAKKEIPNHRVIRDKLGSPLAEVMFKYMPPLAKVKAGLEPVMQGPGKDEFLHPKDQLAMRNAKVPVDKEVLKNLSVSGIEYFGYKAEISKIKEIREKIKTEIRRNDLFWRRTLKNRLNLEEKRMTKIEKKKTYMCLNKLTNRFDQLFKDNVNIVELALKDVHHEKLYEIWQNTSSNMKKTYRKYLKKQMDFITNTFIKKYKCMKLEEKKCFLVALDEERSKLYDHIHSIKKQEEIALKYLKEQGNAANLASQLYVAALEREKAMKSSKKMVEEHKTSIKNLRDNIYSNNLTMESLNDEIEASQSYDENWKNHVLKIVYELKKLVDFAIRTVPEQASFFSNVQSLVVAQLNEVLNSNQNAESFIFKCVCQGSDISPECKCEEGMEQSVAYFDYPFIVYTGSQEFIQSLSCAPYCEECMTSSRQPPVYLIDKKFVITKCETVMGNAQNLCQIESLRTQIEEYVEFEKTMASNLPDEKPCVETSSCLCCECHLEEESAHTSKNCSEIDLTMKTFECKCLNMFKNRFGRPLPAYMDVKQSTYISQLYEKCNKKRIKSILTESIPPLKGEPKKVEVKKRRKQKEKETQVDEVCYLCENYPFDKVVHVCHDNVETAGLSTLEEIVNAVKSYGLEAVAQKRVESLQSLFKSIPKLKDIFDN